MASSWTVYGASAEEPEEEDIRGEDDEGEANENAPIMGGFAQTGGWDVGVGHDVRSHDIDGTDEEGIKPRCIGGLGRAAICLLVAAGGLGAVQRANEQAPLQTLSSSSVEPPWGPAGTLPDAGLWATTSLRASVASDTPGPVVTEAPAGTEAPAVPAVPSTVSPFETVQPAFSYLLSNPDSGKCPEGSTEVDDESACEAAAKDLDNSRYVGQLKNPSDQPGCLFRVGDMDVYFNAVEQGSRVPKPQTRRPVCQQKGARTTTTAAPIPQGTSGLKLSPEDEAIRIFCFAWTPLRPSDQKLLLEVRVQFRQCNGHVFFTDADAPHVEGDDIVRVTVPPQKTQRESKQWLYHRNMVGVLPSLTHLLTKTDLSAYDWLIHTELDHFLSPARLRWTVAEYVRLLQSGSPSERQSVDKSLMLMFGNAFLFNTKMVDELRRQWDRLGVAADAQSEANGCPEFMRGKEEWPLHCSQDIIYPTLVHLTHPSITAVGRSGCGQFDAKNGKDRPFPAGCWEMQKNPWGEGEEGELRAIREFAKVQTLSKKQVQGLYAGTTLEKHWELFYNAKTVPLIHHVGHAAVHRLARELLRP